jgi:hypothetical protein
LLPKRDPTAEARPDSHTVDHGAHKGWPSVIKAKFLGDLVW